MFGAIFAEIDSMSADVACAALTLARGLMLMTERETFKLVIET